jgi:hypothetical protein
MMICTGAQWASLEKASQADYDGIKCRRRAPPAQTTVARIAMPNSGQGESDVSYAHRQNQGQAG